MIHLDLPCNVLMAGSTMSGKSFLLKKILKEQVLKSADYIIIMSPTCLISGDWSEPMWDDQLDPKKGLVVQKFDTGFKTIIQEMMESQLRLLQSKKLNEIPHIVMILDDCLGDSILNQNGLMAKFSTFSRHYHMTTFILVQQITACPRTYRINAKYCIMFNSSNFSELERFLDEYVPKKYKKLLETHLEDIYNQDFNFILTQNFCRKLSDRLLVNGNKDESIIAKYLKNN